MTCSCLDGCNGCGRLVYVLLRGCEYEGWSDIVGVYSSRKSAEGAKPKRHPRDIYYDVEECFIQL